MNKEIINQLKSTKTVDELKKLATENGYSLNEEEANHYFDLFHTEGKITDEELNSVAGGACGEWCRGGSRYSSEPPHYLIVVPGFNKCKLFSTKGVSHFLDGCSNCEHRKPSGITSYCKKRTFDSDSENPPKTK